MELVYSTQNSDFDPEKRYRNPAHFDRPEAGVTHAVVIGDWPKVVDAYEAQGVEVSVLKPLISEPIDSDAADIIASLEQDNATLRVERDGVLRLIEDVEGQSELEHPGAGELPIRLFDALNSIHEGIASLKSKRDELLGEVESLREDVARLTPASQNNGSSLDELTVVQIKEQLDAKGVAYKVNDSKPELLALLKANQ